MKHDQIDSRVYKLYDEYCHGEIDRRQFFDRAAAITVGGVSALSMAKAMVPDYASGQEVKFTDDRIHPTYIEYDSPGGNSGKMRGYLVTPEGSGPFPAVLVIHENRGLNPYIEDVARRAAVAGFLTLAPDGLSPVGGYPGNDDDGRAMQRALDQDKLRQDMLNSAYHVKHHELSTGMFGCTGFCWGGATSNFLAVEMGGDIQASVPFYGRAPELDRVKNIEAALLLQYAENDEGVNSTREDYVAALEEHNIVFESYTYPNTLHGFHNYSTPRYNADAAKLAWERTVAHWYKYLK
jgi:carboxymethylenebutenolidase